MNWHDDADKVRVLALPSSTTSLHALDPISSICTLLLQRSFTAAAETAVNFTSNPKLLIQPFSFPL
ncbi:hypothetical protein SDJN02_27656, partial [Cucurbita argyrosperma subsp. argyrosperma]